MISPCVGEAEPDEAPTLGMLVAAGPRAAADPGEYSLLFESVREGYLLHYASPRILAGHDPDLALLAGDYLYALGLERLAELGDLDAVRELSDLISLSAQLHGEHRDGEQLGALWLAAAIAIGCGSGPAHEAAKAHLRSGGADAATRLLHGALGAAAEAGIGEPLGRAADAIDFPLDLHS